MQFNRTSLPGTVFARGMTSTSEERRERARSYRPSAVEARPLRGLTLIEALVGSALILIVFLSIFAVFQVSIDLVFSTKAATSATALVNERVEYIRGLSYETIGTSGGIPSGSIPQIEQVILNGIPYTLSTLVQYVDDPTDGLDEMDETGVTADYKIIRVEANWLIRNVPRSTFAVTTIAPVGIESLTDGGTLRVNVFDTLAAPVAGATVHIVNNSVSPAVDVTVTTGVAGSVAFPGAPPGSGYSVNVSKAGYSSAQTYSVTVANPNPSPGHVAVVDQTTTTISLSIDVTGSLVVRTFSPIGPGNFTDAFATEALLSATTTATVSGGSLVLEGEPGTYASSGTASSNGIAPQYLVSWANLVWDQTTPTDTSALVFLYFWDGAEYVLVPDSDLPGNSAGFSNESVDISTLPVGTYGQLQIQALLASADPQVTPEILEWDIGYTAGPTPLPNADFDIHGTKSIGVSAGGAPIYKYEASNTTNGSGLWTANPIEADAYSVSMPSGSPYVISDICPASPSVAPGNATNLSLTLEDSSTQNSIRVVVTGNSLPVTNATVSVVGGIVDENKSTSACGQAFFGDLPTATYVITVTAGGYQTAVESDISVTGDTVITIPLVAL